MNRSKMLKATALAAFLSLTTSAAMAGTITVTNANFETLPTLGLDQGNAQGAGNYSDEVGIPGWTVAGEAGQWTPTITGNPAQNQAFNSAPDPLGIIAWSNGPEISQTVGATVQVGDVYTLTVDLGYRYLDNFGGSADLLVNGQTYVATGTTPAQGDWSVFTATYTGLASDAGDSITIELNTVAGWQGDFSDVSLTGNPQTTPNAITPEPSSFLLLGSGLVGLGGMIRRKLKA